MKKILNATTIFSIIALTLIYSCGNKANKTKAVVADIDSIRMELVFLQDSTSKTWQAMIGEDDQKIAYLKRLIDEVSFTKLYDKAVYDSLSTGIENLKAIRYNENTMTDSGKIDLYDDATAEVVNKVIAFARNHPNYEEYPIMEELINDILAADNRVIYRRVDYDNIAIEYNKFIESNQELIRQSGNVVSTKPLFQLSE